MLKLSEFLQMYHQLQRSWTRMYMKHICIKSLVKELGPVVQSIASLTSSLRGQLVKF